MVSKDLVGLLLNLVSLTTGPSIAHQLAQMASGKDQQAEDGRAWLRTLHEGIQDALREVAVMLGDKLLKQGQESTMQLISDLGKHHSNLFTASGEAHACFAMHQRKITKLCRHASLWHAWAKALISSPLSA